jgi:hypothetical protein
MLYFLTGPGGIYLGLPAIYSRSLLSAIDPVTTDMLQRHCDPDTMILKTLDTIPK